MSQMVEIKVRLETGKKTRFDAHCDALGASRNERMNAIMDADMDGRIAAEPRQPAAPKPVSAADQIHRDHERLLSKLEELFAGNRSTMSRLLAPLKSIASVALTEKRFDSVETQQKEMETQLDQLQKTVLNGSDVAFANTTKRFDRLDRALQVERPSFFHDRRVQGGFALGIASLILVQALVPGTSFVARGFAKLALGESDVVLAASRLAGEGESVSEAMVRTSLQLARDDAFLENYKACIDTAKASSKQTSCSLLLPALK